MKYVFFVLSFITSVCLSQSYSSKSKKAIKLFEKALAAPRENKDEYGRQNFTIGLEIIKKTIEKDPLFIEAYLLGAEYAESIGQSKLAISYFEKAIEINPSHTKTGATYFYLGMLKFKEGEYSDALKKMTSFLQFKNANPIFIQQAELTVECCKFALDALKNPSEFKPMNIGPGINTAYPEYYPTITVDGKTILFTRRIKDDRVHGPFKEQEDFFISHFKKDFWSLAEPMPQNINTLNNEGAPSLAADGRTLIFIACPDASGYEYGMGRSGKGSCDMFITKKLGSRWSNALNLPGLANTANWETQPSLSSDGKTLYFIRTVKNQAGNRNSDIYVSFLQDDGNWSAGIKLPGNINTIYEEESVLIHPDGKTLYFSSKGHVGMGGYDLYVSRKDSQGRWGDPVNLGYPINTKDDENSLMVSPDGTIGYFASNRAGGMGDLDIYFFEMPTSIQPEKTLYFDGLVFDAETKKAIPGKFQLISIETGKEIVRSEADQLTGAFLVSLPVNNEYALSVSYPGYNFFSKNFNMIEKENQEAVHLDIPLIPIGNEQAIELANVFFDLSKTTLRNASYVELNKLKDFLSKNPTLHIEIGGHTDSRGSATENQVLSEGRARAVKEYLISQGIESERMTYKGYGSSAPIHNDAFIMNIKSAKEQEKAHQRNRRTEYKLITQ
jgi:outer membrane protein OmpA-like peptidoglycan-associated protein/tetratricopeptide (TPR) repeat protein